MLEIDGSHGEAGGQILRTALSLSCLLNKPFRMFNIRKGRKKPGLMPQHLMCIHGLKLISNGKVKGDEKGSMELVFEPSEVKSGDYFFDIGTAGSTSLLLQSILPPLLFTKDISSVILKGGTHVPFSPPFHYIKDVFIRMLNRLGITLTAGIENYGFYPKGGGEIKVKITPSKDFHGLSFLQRGELKTITGISCTGNLPLSIAERQRNSANNLLTKNGLRADMEILSVPSPGQGSFIFLMLETAGCIAGFSSLGERGKKAETVGEEASKSLIKYYSNNACIDPHLSDQIVIYLALAKGESSFTTSCITNHLLTNLWVIEKFIGLKYKVTGEKGIPGKVVLTGKDMSVSS